VHEKAHTDNLEDALYVKDHSEYKGELFEYDVLGALVLAVTVVVYGHSHGVAEDHKDDKVVKILILDDVHHHPSKVVLMVKQVQRPPIIHYYLTGNLPFFVLFPWTSASLRHVILQVDFLIYGNLTIEEGSGIGAENEDAFFVVWIRVKFFPFFEVFEFFLCINLHFFALEQRSYAAQLRLLFGHFAVVLLLLFGWALLLRLWLFVFYTSFGWVVFRTCRLQTLV